MVEVIQCDLIVYLCTQGEHIASLLISHRNCHSSLCLNSRASLNAILIKHNNQEGKYNNLDLCKIPVAYDSKSSIYQSYFSPYV